MLPKLIPKANFGRKTRKKHYFGRFPLGFGTFGSSVFLFALAPPLMYKPKICSTEPKLCSSEAKPCSTEPNLCTTEPNAFSTEPDGSSIAPYPRPNWPKPKRKPKLCSTEPKLCNTKPKLCSTKPNLPLLSRSQANNISFFYVLESMYIRGNQGKTKDPKMPDLKGNRPN